MAKTITLTDAEFRYLVETDETNLDAFADFIGKDIFVRTITMSYTGHVEWIKGSWMKLTTATWVADTGRFSDFVLKGKPTGTEEYEPMGTTVLNTSTFLDVTLLKMELPFIQK